MTSETISPKSDLDSRDAATRYQAAPGVDAAGALDAETAARHRAEIAAGERFEFGANWRAFLSTLTPERIREAEASLRDRLGVETLEGKTFLDIGSGSGLFSLAARNLGARVTSFDYDPASVACTAELRRRYWQDDPNWRVAHGSVLEPAYMEALGTFDIVYSWGVLHHTGAMWTAIDNAIGRVAPEGLLFIAIYNDQGAWSGRWRRIKQFYCRGPVQRWLVSAAFIPFWVARQLVADLVWLRNPTAMYRTYKRTRGMSVVRDWFDWLGGFPFEYAKPEDMIFPIQKRGFALQNLVTQRGSVGCVEYVFHRTA